jgi:pyruvate ferredoxin oxidoreductase gamma subunit
MEDGFFILPYLKYTDVYQLLPRRTGMTDKGNGHMTEIRWHGRGGQGVVTAGKLLADTALDAGQYFQAFPDYGPERMGAPIRAFTRLSDSPITIHSQIEAPDVVLVLDPTIIGPVDVAEGLKPGGIIIINTAESPQKMRKKLNLTKDSRLFTVNASHIAIEEMGREITNTPMIGAFAAVTKIFSVKDLVEQTRAKFAGKLSTEMVEANVRAIERASKEVQEG